MANTIANTVFELNVSSEGESEVVVPNTGSFTSTTQNQVNTNNGAAIVIISVIAVLAIVASIVFRKLSKKTRGFQLSNKKFSIASLSSIIVFLFCIGLLGEIIIVDSYFTHAASNNLDVALESDEKIIMNKNKFDDFASQAKVKVKLAKPQQAGYTFNNYMLYMEATKLEDENGNTINTVTSTELPINTWGYKVSEDETSYIEIPYSKSAIVSAVWNGDTEEVEISFYVKLSPEAIDGKYTSTISFRAVSDGREEAEPELPVSTCTVNWNANGGLVSPSSATKNCGGQLGNLPTPTRDGYNFLGWFTTATGGIQISANTIVSSNTTYYAHWEEIAPSGCSYTMPIFYMQDITTTIKTEMCEDKQYQLKDKRDEKIYWVAKLKDGNVWMTQNLDYDLSANPNLETTTSDVTSNRTISMNKDWWVDAPDYYDGGNYYIANGTGSKTAITCTGSSNGGENCHYHLGDYYTWSAAVAENDTTSYTAMGTQMPSSICPKGWRLPQVTNSTTGDFANLWNNYQEKNVWEFPLFFTLAGYAYEDTSDIIGTTGDVWSGTVYSSNDAFDLDLYKTNRVRTYYYGSRYYGHSVRCIAR